MRIDGAALVCVFGFLVGCKDEKACNLLSPPSGTIRANLESSASKTLLDGSVVWQTSCPQDNESAKVDFALNRVTLYRDDAGDPGEKIGDSELHLSGGIACADRTISAGSTKTQAFEPVEVVNLRELCVERAKRPTGGPLYVHVEVTGEATACGTEKSNILFRSKTGVSCKE